MQQNQFLQQYLIKTIPYTLNGQTNSYDVNIRIDPFSGNVSKISKIRAKRSLGIDTEIDIHPVEKCEFCNYEEKTPKERIKHNGGAITVPNMFPWEKYDWITIYPPFGKHKLLLSDIYFDDLEAMVESGYELATICKTDPEVVSFMDFTNWGAFAGASQQHPHSQRKSITIIPDPVQEREWQRCKELGNRYWRNPFDVYLEEERKRGERVIHDDGVAILAAFAPEFSGEVLAFPQRNISHILQTTYDERKSIIDTLLGIFPALFFYHGVTDLNIAVHMAPFNDMEEAKKYYRLHIHVYPRRSRLPADRAGAEIGFQTNVIDWSPEEIAALIRDWYQNGPRREKVLSKRLTIFDNLRKELVTC